MTRPRVIVTGSRAWPRPWVVEGALEDAATRLGPFTVVHGNCPTGADAQAARWAARRQGLGVTAEPHRADWARYGRRAGPIRNQAMVQAGAVLVLAFPWGSSAGTRGCMSLAEAAGIPIHVYRPDGHWGTL